MSQPDFDFLTPDNVLHAVESAFSVRLDGTLQAYSSYVNRVYGIRTDDGDEYVVKFYRPGRWTDDALAEEHEFVLDCADAELPVVAPIADSEGDTLQTLEVESESGVAHAAFALYAKRGGRGFDAESDDDWLRLGTLLGRLHLVASRHRAEHRLTCTPLGSTVQFVNELLDSGAVYGDLLDEFRTVVEEAIALITPLFDSIPTQRIHGDFHRGNVLEREGEGLLIIDFDDMMMGPPVQDLWLLLPDHAFAAMRELNLLLEGYEQFVCFDRATLALIEPLRLMRMIYYLAWSAYQLSDHKFLAANPDWGSRAFWIREVEDLRTQASVIVAEMRDRANG